MEAVVPTVIVLFSMLTSAPHAVQRQIEAIPVIDRITRTGVEMSISTLDPKDKDSSRYAQYCKMEEAKTLKMAIIEPFEQHCIEYENWFEK